MSKFLNFFTKLLETPEEESEKKPDFQILRGNTLKVHAVEQKEFQEKFFAHFESLLAESPEEIIVDLAEVIPFTLDSLSLLRSACIAALEQGVGINILIHPDSEVYFQSTDWAKKIPREVVKACQLEKKEAKHVLPTPSERKRDDQPSFVLKGNSLTVNYMSPENFQNRFFGYFHSLLESNEENIVIDISELEVLPVDSLRIWRNACLAALEAGKGVRVFIHPSVEKTLQAQEWAKKIPREIHPRFYEAARNGLLDEELRIELEHTAPKLQIVGNCLEVRKVNSLEFQEKFKEYLKKIVAGNCREVKIDISRIFEVSENFMRILRDLAISALAQGMLLRTIIHPEMEETFRTSRWGSSLTRECCDATTAQFITRLRIMDEEAKSQKEQCKLTAALRLTGMFTIAEDVPLFQIKKNCLEIRDVSEEKFLEEFPMYLNKLSKEGYNKIIIDISRMKKLSAEIIDILYDAYNEMEELGTWMLLRIAPSMENGFKGSGRARMIPREKYIPLS
jgi:anti-anti-sigma regulatory factor